MLDEFKKRDTVILGIAQEDINVEEFRQIGGKLKKAEPDFKLGADIGYQQTLYDRTHIYLIDKAGVVRQVMPMKIYRRPPWSAVIKELDALQFK